MKRIVLLLALVLGLTGEASAKQISEFRVGAWYGGAYTSDKNGAFTSCIASAVYNSGITMLVRVDREFRWEIGFRTDKWKLNPGENIRVKFRIDRSPWEYVTATAYSDNGVLLPMDARDGLVKRFRGGRLLELRDKDESFHFDLKGTSRLMVKLVRCTERQLALEPTQPPQTERTTQRAEADTDTVRNDTVAPLERQMTTTTSTERTQARTARKETHREDNTKRTTTTAFDDQHLVAEGTRVLSNFITNAGLKNSLILSPSDVPDSLQFAHSVATASGQIAFVFVVSDDIRVSRNDVTAALSNKLSGVCEGDFLSGKSRTVIEGSKVSTGFAACDHDNKLTQIRYVVTPRGQGGIYLIGLISGDGGDWNTSIEGIVPEDSVGDEALRMAAFQASR